MLYLPQKFVIRIVEEHEKMQNYNPFLEKVRIQNNRRETPRASLEFREVEKV